MPTTAKQITFEAKARARLAAGVNKLADAVSVTLGPKGRYVAIETQRSAPLVTNDGVTVARNIDLPDHIENMGAQLVKEVAIKTNDVAGDGTTTATLFAQVLVNEGLRNVTAGANALAIRNGIDKAVDAVVAKMRDNAHQVESSEQIANVGTISAGDARIGRKIADAMEIVGKEGVITVEDSSTLGIEIDAVKGMEFNKGFLSHYFVTDKQHMVCEMKDPYILITDQPIMFFAEIVKICEQVVKMKRSLLIIAEQVEGDALSQLALNKMRGAFDVCAVTAPAFGPRRKYTLEDIAALTGGQAILGESGIKLQQVGLEMLGEAKGVKVTKDSTTIIDGLGSQSDLDDRIAIIKESLKTADPGYETEKLQERLAHLAGGVAVLKVGAATEVELKERKSRIEDALQATRAAVEEGIVPGGGVAFINAIDALDNVEVENSDEQVGVNIVRKALSVPLATIAQNSGYEGAVIVEKIRDMEPGQGLNSYNGEWGDMIEMGVLDPVKVSRTALQNAASIAGLILITEATISQIPQPETIEQAIAYAAGGSVNRNTPTVVPED